MLYRSFHGERISALGMGGMRYPGVNGDENHIDRAAGQRVIDAAMAAGINYFDSGFTYQGGDSERFLGEALRRYPRRSYNLATKFNVGAGPDIEATFAEQLRRTGAEYFDFYLLHTVMESNFDAYTDPVRDYIGFLRRQKEAGRVRYIGFSSHCKPDTLRRFLDVFDGWDMALLQINYLDWIMLDAKTQYEIVTERGIPIWVMEPQKGGLLTRMRGRAGEMLDAAAPDRTRASWGFRFLQGLPNVVTVLSGAGDPTMVLENAATMSACDPLTARERETVLAAAEQCIRELGVPCSGCRYCCDTCPAELNIPILLQEYNDRRINGDGWRFGKPEGAKDAADCLGCGVCLEKCPQHIDIPATLRALAEMQKK